MASGPTRATAARSTSAAASPRSLRCDLTWCTARQERRGDDADRVLDACPAGVVLGGLGAVRAWRVATYRALLERLVAALRGLWRGFHLATGEVGPMSGTTTTPNYALIKPVPNADDDLWGAHLNQNADTLDTIIKTVETKANTVPAASTTLPSMDGTAAIGVGTTYARADHIHPVDTSRAAVSAIPAASTTLPLIEGTAAIGVSTMYARSDHVHPSVALRVRRYRSPIRHLASPNVGDMWWDSLGTQLYLRYDDGNSKQWVPATNQTGGVGEAASDGYQYARRNAAWSRVATPDVGRNLIHNALFTVAQRGAGPWTATGYTADRWYAAYSNDTGVSVSVTFRVGRIACRCRG